MERVTVPDETIIQMREIGKKRQSKVVPILVWIPVLAHGKEPHIGARVSARNLSTLPQSPNSWHNPYVQFSYHLRRPSMSTGTDPTSPSESESEKANWCVGKHVLNSRLIVGTGRYDTMEQMKASLEASGSDCVTVAVRRERLYDKSGQNILDFLDSDRYTLLPNTAGCYTATDAVRAAKLGREILRTLGNPGADWVKLEVLGDSKTLLPDPGETVKACEQLAADGFSVLCYTSDCPVTAVR